MECKECCRDISADEYRKNAGYCEKCYANFIEPKLDETTTTDEEGTDNPTANKIKAISLIVVTIGVIVGFITVENSGWKALIIIIISVVSSIFIYGYGEIIQILEDIYWKIEK